MTRPHPTHRAPSTGAADTIIRVRYVETDAQGVVSSPHYLVWFEIGRTEWCRQAGIDYRRLEGQGYYLVVTKATCRYLAPARYDDEVIVRTTLAASKGRGLEFHYEVRLKEGEPLLAKGATSHLWIDRKGKPTVLPSSLQQLFDKEQLREA